MRLIYSTALAFLVALLPTSVLSQQDIDIQITPLKTVALLGEPVFVNITVTNRTEQPMEIDFGNTCFGNTQLKVQVPKAESGLPPYTRCPTGGFAGSCLSTGPGIVLAKASTTRSYVLKGDYRITHPGDYTVHLEKEIGFAPSPEGRPSYPSKRNLQRLTEKLDFTLTVQPPDGPALLATEAQLAQSIPKRAYPVKIDSETTPSYERRIAQWQNDDFDDLLNRNALYDGIAESPAPGMEPLLQSWLNTRPLQPSIMRGLKLLNTSESRAILATVAEPTSKRLEDYRAFAVQALGDLGDKTYLPLLERMVTDSDQNVRYYATQGIAILGGEQEIDRLTDLARHRPDPMDRQIALSSLGDTDTLAAVVPIIYLAASEDPDQRWSPVNALRTLTHLEFPVDRTASSSSLGSTWKAFWFAHQQNARAYSPYECTDTPQPARLQ